MVQYYREYMETLEGELDYEKEVFIEDEYERVIVTMEINNELVMNGQNIDLEAMQYAIDIRVPLILFMKNIIICQDLKAKRNRYFIMTLTGRIF